MIVELRNCSLEIGHIGTRRDIALELLEDSLDALKKAMISFSESLCNTLQNAMIGFVNSMCGAIGPTCAIVNGAIDQPIKKSRRQKNVERVAQDAERKQRFAKGAKWK